MAEELLIESNHALVLTPFDKDAMRSATAPLEMRDFRIWDKHDLPAFVAETHAPVQVFTVQKVAFIQSADIFVCLTGNQHTGAGNRFDLYWMVRQ